MAPNAGTGAPNRPNQSNNPYYAHIAYVVNMGSDGQGAYSLSLFMLTPASKAAIIGGPYERGAWRKHQLIAKERRGPHRPPFVP